MSIRFRLNNCDCEGYITHAQEEMDCGLLVKITYIMHEA